MMRYFRLAIFFILLCFLSFRQVVQLYAVTNRPDVPQQRQEEPPPLPGGCGGFGTPTSYENPVCCVSGYVYVDGVPVAGAAITVRLNDKLRTDVTIQSDDVANPYYTVRLDTTPLLVRPGSLVTVTATYGELSASRTFIAKRGGQQVDLVLPRLVPDSSWQPVTGASEALAPPFLQRAGYAIAPEGNGRYLIFGGALNGVGLGTPVADTYRWRLNGWEKLSPTIVPPARMGHQFARRSVDGALLLFGGLGRGETFLADTWLWSDEQWHKVDKESASVGMTTSITPTAPSPRAWYAITYDETRQNWLLFGGGTATATFGDTWIFKAGQWIEQHPANSPPPRKMATLTYKADTGLLYLFGGRAKDQIFDDFWQWDGQSWQEIIRDVRPLGRYGHAAAYHPPTHSLIIAGGSAAGSLRDTWAWDGVRWRRRVTEPLLMPYQRATMYDEMTNEKLILFGELTGGNDEGEGIAHFIVKQPPSDAIPIATIQYADHLDIRQGRDRVTLLGEGSDGDATDAIIGYRWAYGDAILGSQQSLTLDASQLPLGLQTLSFTVQDDEGNWSFPVKRNIWVRNEQTGALGFFQPKWTLLFYISADKGAPTLPALIEQFRSAGPQVGVDLALFVDSPQQSDSQLYHLTAQGDWQTLPLTAIQSNLDALNGSHAETLGRFIRWGQSALPNEYMALFLMGPSNAVVGFGKDAAPAPGGVALSCACLVTHRSQTDYLNQMQGIQMVEDGSLLTPADLRTALEIGTAGGYRQLDLLYLDGSSFGLLENAASVHGFAQYVIASPGTRAGGYPYNRYRQLAAATQTPRAYATTVAQAYATQGRMAGLPITVAVWDMAYFAPVAAAVAQLGAVLTAYGSQSPGNQAQLAQIRQQLQHYDSGGKIAYQLDAEDAYIDLVHFVETLGYTQTNGAILEAALQVRDGTQKFVIWADATTGSFQRDGSTTWLAYPNHHGIGIFYPPTGYALDNSANAAYRTHKLFPLTAQWSWTQFILPDDLPPLPPNYRPPQTASDLLLASIDTHSAPPSLLYLPFISR